MGLIGWNAYKLEMEHLEHIEDHPPEFINYPHLRITAKVFQGEIDCRISGGAMESIPFSIPKNSTVPNKRILLLLL
jgi:hypothetical protein